MLGRYCRANVSSRNKKSNVTTSLLVLVLHPVLVLVLSLPLYPTLYPPKFSNLFWFWLLVWFLVLVWLIFVWLV